MLSIFVYLSDHRKLRSFMKLGGFQVIIARCLFICQVEPVSAEGLTERKQIRLFVLGTSWGSEANAQRGPRSSASLPSPS